MILLNGVPPIIGVGFIHVTIINLVAIAVEHHYLKRKLRLKGLKLRVILANCLSLVMGLVAMLTLSDVLPGVITRLGMDFYDFEDRLALLPSLLTLVVVNIVVEMPAYLFDQGENRARIALEVFKANLITNIPIVVLYGLLAF